MPSAQRKITKRYENLLFLKRLMKNPIAMGAVFPSSKALAKFICRHVDYADEEYVVEIGAGTGRFTQALLDNGIPCEKIIAVELDPELSQFLKHRFPKIQVVQGDATQLDNLLPPEVCGKVRTIVSGIPMVNIPKKIQIEIMQAAFVVLRPEGKFLQFTYGPVSPLPARRLGLVKKRLGHILLNFPPATVWRYEKGDGLTRQPKRAFVRVLREKWKQAL